MVWAGLVDGTAVFWARRRGENGRPFWVGLARAVPTPTQRGWVWHYQ
jgi:hypothetical protein